MFLISHADCIANHELKWLTSCTYVYDHIHIYMMSTISSRKSFKAWKWKNMCGEHEPHSSGDLILSNVQLSEAAFDNETSPYPSPHLPSGWISWTSSNQNRIGYIVVSLGNWRVWPCMNSFPSQTTIYTQNLSPETASDQVHIAQENR